MAGCSEIFFWLTAGVKKLSICGNCYFILTLLGVCHETVAFFCHLNYTCRAYVSYHGHVYKQICEWQKCYPA